MNRNLLIGLIIAGILAIGGLGYYLSNNSDDDTTNTETAQTDGSPLFPSELIHYPVTMNGTSTNPDNPESDGTFKISMQDENTWEMELTTEEGTGRFIYVADATYIQNPDDGSWIKSPSTGDSPIDNVGFNNDDIAGYQENATYQGKQNCPAGTCDTWSWTNPENPAETATIKVDSQGRISEVSAVSDGNTVLFTYDYDTPVNIEIPADFVELGIPS